jgi:hypothetical protein
MVIAFIAITVFMLAVREGRTRRKRRRDRSIRNKLPSFYRAGGSAVYLTGLSASLADGRG